MRSQINRQTVGRLPPLKHSVDFCALPFSSRFRLLLLAASGYVRQEHRPAADSWFSYFFILNIFYAAPDERTLAKVANEWRRMEMPANEEGVGWKIAGSVAKGLWMDGPGGRTQRVQILKAAEQRE